MPNIKLSEPERQRLGILLWDNCETGLSQRSNAATWWKAVEAFYRNEQPESPGKNLAAVHMAFLQPRVDALTAQSCTVVGKQEPYMVASNETDVAVKTLKEKAVHKLWQAAGFESQLQKASENAANLNKGIYNLLPNNAPTPLSSSGGQVASNCIDAPGVQINVIHPSDFSVFPAGLGGIQQAEFVGHRFYRTLRECKEMIASGMYYKKADPQAGADPSAEDETGRYDHSKTTLGSIGSEQDSQLVELWDAVATIVVNDQPAQRYHVVIAKDTQELLLLEPYPFSLVWYFDSFYLPNTTEFWGGRSVGRNLAGPQDMFNKLWSTLYTGGMSSAKPPMIGPKLAEKYAQWEWGAYIESDEPVQPWSPTITFRGEPIMAAITSIERIGDQIAAISQNTMGSVQGRSTTATTDSIVAAGVSVLLERYIANFSTPLPAMASLTCEMMATVENLYANVQGYYGDDWQAPIEVFQEKTIWEPNGKTPNSTPMAKVAAAQQLFQLSKDPEIGIDKYKLGQVMVNNSALAGMDGVQMTPEQIQQKQMEMMLMQAQANMQVQMEQMAKNGGSVKPNTNGASKDKEVDGATGGLPPEVMAAAAVLQGQ